MIWPFLKNCLLLHVSVELLRTVLDQISFPSSWNAEALIEWPSAAITTLLFGRSSPSPFVPLSVLRAAYFSGLLEQLRECAWPLLRDL